MVADEQRVLHRAGRNVEGLQREGNDEQAGHQHDGHGGDEFRSGFLRLLWLSGWLRFGGAVFSDFLVSSQSCSSSQHQGLACRPSLLHGPQHAVPAQTLEQVGHVVRQTGKSIRRHSAGERRPASVHRPVDHQRTARQCFPRAQSPSSASRSCRPDCRPGRKTSHRERSARRPPAVSATCRNHGAEILSPYKPPSGKLSRNRSRCAQLKVA